MNYFQSSFASAIANERNALLNHRLYGKLQTMDQLAVFMEHHVFAVWDFMSLLKALQLHLTSTRVPWIPQGDARVRRLVNEIVLGEESDVLPGGGYASHFELYLKAMREVGARTAPIEKLMEVLNSGRWVTFALEQPDIPAAVKSFVGYTFAVIERGRPHEIAAAFTYGREDLIPDMFTQLVRELDRQFPNRLTTLRYYLDRHIELDGDQHGEMGRQMVEWLCKDDPFRQQEAKQVAVVALQSRLKLWDGIAEAVENSAKS